MSNFLGRPTPNGRSLLGRQKPPVGVLVIEISSPALWMMFANAGADFGVIDMEHSSLSHRDVARLVLGARCTTLPAIVRVPELSHSAIGRALSIGADGVLVPGVERLTTLDGLFATADSHRSESEELRSAEDTTDFGGRIRGRSQRTRTRGSHASHKWSRQPALTRSRRSAVRKASMPSGSAPPT